MVSRRMMAGTVLDSADMLFYTAKSFIEYYVSVSSSFTCLILNTFFQGAEPASLRV